MKKILITESQDARRCAYSHSRQTKPIVTRDNGAHMSSEEERDKTADNYQKRKSFYERYGFPTYRSWADKVRQI